MIEPEKTYLERARNVSKRSPCHRSKVGAVIVKHGKVMVEGINEPPAPQKNCSEIKWCYRDRNEIKSGTEPDRCRCFGCHAETNAILAAAKMGYSTNGATMYVHGNTEICRSCRAAIASSGIKMIIYESKHGEIERVNPEYDWSINELDQPLVYKNWKKTINEEKGEKREMQDRPRVEHDHAKT